MSEIEPSLASFVAYVWARVFSWQGLIQLVWALWVALGAAWHTAGLLLGLSILYFDRLIAYFFTDYLYLNVTAVQ